MADPLDRRGGTTAGGGGCDRDRNAYAPAGAAAQGWRARVKIHPAADLFPLLPPDELRALAEDIARHGVREPIVLWHDGLAPHDEAGRKRVEALRDNLELPLLDGRNRLAALAQAGMLTDTALALEVGRARIVYGGDPVAYVISANLRRRHLDREQRRALIARLLEAYPDRSDRAIAGMARASDHTVAAVRRGFAGPSEASVKRYFTGAQIAHMSSDTLHSSPRLRVGADGKTYLGPAPRRPVAPAPTPPPPTPAPPEDAPDIAAAIAAIERNPDAALAALAKAAFGLRARIADVPHDRRVVLARRFLLALGLTPHDVAGGGP